MGIKYYIGVVIAFCVGALCRRFEIAAPAPPAIPGALLVVAMTLGYAAADKFWKPAKTAAVQPSVQTENQPKTPNDLSK